MAGPSDILSEYINQANAPIDKATEVLAASAAKQSELGYRDAARTDLGLGRPTTAADIISEVTDPMQVIARGQGMTRFGNDSVRNRTGGETALDSIKGVGLGLGGSLLNIANMGVGMVSDDAGADMARWISQKISDRQAEQSDGLNAHRRVDAARSEITQEENARKYEFDRKTDGNMVAGFKRIGRDFLDAAGRTINDPTLLADVSASGVGSLFAGGGIGKGLQALRFGAGAMPAAIGLLEGGGAYQQTTNEALERGASNEDANNAGLTAAAIQAPIGAATGLLTSRFEANPLNVNTIKRAFADVLKEGTEEGIQSGSGQAVQNFALSQKVTPDQDLLAGVGEQAGIGAIGGLGTAGILQAPGAGVQATVNAAKGIGSLGSSAYNAIGSRGDNIIQTEADKAPNSAVNISAGIQLMPSMAETMNEQLAGTDAAPKNEAYLQNLVKRVFTPVQANSPSEIVNELSSGGDHVFKQLSTMASLAADENADPKDRISAGVYIQDVLDTKNSAEDMTLREELLAAIEQIDDNHPALETLRQMEDTVLLIDSNPEVQQAVQIARDIAAKVSAAEIEKVDTPEAQAKVQGIVSLAQNEPEKTNPEVLDQILMHSEKGSVELSPEGLEAVQAAKQLHDIAADTQVEATRIGAKVPDVMTTPIDRITSDTNVSNDIRTNRDKDAAPSASTYLKEIARAVKTGNPELAREKLQEIMLFAKHMQGKVNALNTNLANGNWSKDNRTSFPVLTLETRKFIPDGGSINILPFSEGSVKFARRVNLDAQSVVSMANALATTYPKLGIKPVPFTPLDVKVNEGDLVEVLRSYRKGGKYAAQPTGQPVQNTEASIEAAPSVVEKTIAPATEADTTVAVATPEASPEVQTEGGDRSPAAKVVKPTLVETASKTDVKSENTQSEKTTANETIKSTDAVVADTEEAPSTETRQEKAPEADKAKTPKLKPMEAAYPNLIEDKEKGVVNYFRKAFKLPKSEEPVSRLTADGAMNGNPIAEVHDALGSKSLFSQMAGGTANKLTDKVSQAYQTIVFSTAQQIADALDKSLQAKLDTKPGKKEDFAKEKTFREYLIEGGKNLTGMRDLRALNLTEIVDGQVKYNENLIEAAILAGYQWLLGLNQKSRRMDAEEISQKFGISEHQANNIQNKVNDGVPRADGLRSLAAQIVKFWGLEKQSSIARGHTEGIPEAIAKELALALQEVGLIKLDNSLFFEYEDGSKKTYARIVITKDEVVKAAQAFPDAIEQLIMVDPDPVNYIGTPPTKVATYQMRNRLVENTAKQKLEIERENNIPYRVNYNTFNFAQKVGKDEYLRLFGHGDLSKQELNVKDRESKEGQNLNIASAFDYMMGLVDNISLHANSTGINDVRDVPVFFEHNSSRVGRTQQIGRATPQGNKIVREMLLSTWSTIDLNDSKNYDKFMLSMAQHWDIKVEKQTRAANVADAEAFALTIPKTLKLLQDWLARDGKLKLASADIDTIKAEFGSKLSPGAFHAAMDYARYLNASTAERAAFKTAAYVEADGKTDGPINAMMHLASTWFSDHWIKMMAKGGLFLGSTKTTLAEHYTTDQIDLYKFGSNKAQIVLKDFMKKFSNDAIMTNQMNSMLYLMDRYFGKDFDVKKNASGDLEVTIDRGITKNPMTITIYGSGKMGIAGNIANEIMTAIYAELSTQDMPEKVKRALDNLVGSVVQHDRGLYTLAQAKTSMPDTIDRLTFAMGDSEFKTLTWNINQLFIGPLIEGIDAVIGEVNENKVLIRKATQIQSIFAEHAFKTLYAEALEAKKKFDPNWSPSDGLSADEERIIRKQINHLAPYIETGDQSFFLSASDRANLAPLKSDGKTGEAPQFARSLDGTLGSAAYTDGPTAIGVVAIPTMIIATGDGQMMNNYMAADDAPIDGTRVFDGTNIALDKIDEESRKVNRAVYEAWLQGNPLEDVSQSYSAFMTKISFAGYSKSLLLDLDNVFSSRDRKNVAKKGTFEEKVLQMMKNVNSDLKDAALWSQGRKNVLAKVNMGVDHMASAESPHLVRGKIELSDDPEMQAMELNNLLSQEMDKLFERETNRSEDISPEIARYGITDTDSGAKVYNTEQFRKLIRSLKVPVTQSNLFETVHTELYNNGYTLVTGTREQLQAYAQANNHVALTESQKAQADQGYISMGDQTIYLINPSSETLLHELIHATTFNKVAAYYSGGKINPIERDAVERIEQLMREWLDVAEGRAVDVVKFHLANNQKAVALNEFMAWNLSNQDLIKQGREQEVSPSARIAKGVVEFLKKLIWGKAVAPRLGDDLYTNLRFNTAILMNNVPTMQDRMNNTILFQSNSFGKNERLTEMDQKFADKIGRMIKAQPVDGQVKADTATAQSMIVAKTFMSTKLITSMQELYTFRTMVAAAMTEAYLNPNAMTQVQEIYDHVIKKLTPDNFMPVNSIDPAADRYYAQEKFDAIVGNKGVQTDLSGRTSLLPSFLALATTNDEFRAVLRSMDLPKSVKSTDKTVDAFLTNYAVDGLDRLATLLSGQGRGKRNPEEALDALTRNLADTLEDRELYIEQFSKPVGNGFDRANQILSDGMSTLAGKVIDKIDDKLATVKSKAAEATLQLARAFVAMASEDRADEVSKGTIAMVNRWNMPQFVNEIVVELVGRTSDNAGVTDLAKHIRANVQKLRQQFREDVPVIIQGKFSRKLTSEEWTHIYMTARADIGALKQSMSVDKIIQMLQDDNKLHVKIAEFEETLAAIQPDNWPLIQKKAKHLAQYMLTGNSAVAEGNLLKNAYAIAHLFNEHPLAKINANDVTIKAIDQLVSLYAIRGLDKVTRESLSSLAQSEAEGMNFTTNYLIGRRISELEKVEMTGVARANHYKGFVPTENNTGTSLMVASDNERGTLRALGFEPVASYAGSRSELKTDKKSYFYAPLSGKAMFSQGNIQNVRNTASGVDPRTGFSLGVMTAGRITDPRTVKTITARLALNKKATEPLNPIFSEDGTVVAYERSVDPIQEARLEHDTNLSTILGQWIGRQVEEAQAGQINRTVIDELEKMWINEESKNRDQYVNLFDDKKLNPVQRDAVKLFTPETRRYAESVFGKDEFWVRKDMINQVTGYRSASVGDLWTGTTNISEPVRKEAARIITGIFGIDAYRKLVTAEKFYQNFIQDARATIVVKSVIVPIANGISGIYQLASRGVPLVDIANGYPRKLMEANAYLKQRHREIALDAELEGVGSDLNRKHKLEAELQVIRDGYKSLSIYPILHELSSITDAGVTHDTTLLVEGKLSAFIERQVDKLPADLKTAGRYLVISKDTALFKGLQRAVQYGDFLAKAVLYDDLVKRQGKSKEYALGRIMDEFVNYDLLAGRSRSYMENMGLMWFWHFKLRSVKIALSTFRNNPLHMLFAGLVPQPEMFGSIGMPFTDNAFSILGDGRFEYSVGPGMGLSAHQMNPYWNAMF